MKQKAQMMMTSGAMKDSDLPTAAGGVLFSSRKLIL